MESEPAKSPTFTEESDGMRLDIDFTFACGNADLPAGSALIPLEYVPLSVAGEVFLLSHLPLYHRLTFLFSAWLNVKKMVRRIRWTTSFIFLGECYGSGFTMVAARVIIAIVSGLRIPPPANDGAHSCC